jgi:hypothetical protein
VVGKGKKKKRSGAVAGACAPDGGKVAKLPKKKCCVSAPKCNRCPLRMLKEGTLPEGYTVHKRKLVKAKKLKQGKKKLAA